MKDVKKSKNETKKTENYGLWNKGLPKTYKNCHSFLVSHVCYVTRRDLIHREGYRMKEIDKNIVKKKVFCIYYLRRTLILLSIAKEAAE